MTSASRSSYSPDSRVRTSSAAISSRSLARSASASARRTRVALVLGELVEHGQVVEAAPQVLDAPQLALGVREPAGDLLRVLLVVPQVGLARLVLEVRDLGAQRGQVGHRLDALQGAGELLDVGCGVGVHNAPGYAVTPGSVGMAVSMASSSLSMASRCATVNSRDRPLVRVVLGRARRLLGLLEPGACRRRGWWPTSLARSRGERAGVQQPQHERAAQRVGAAGAAPATPEGALARRGDARTAGTPAGPACPAGAARLRRARGARGRPGCG